MGMLSGPGGFSSEAELARRELRGEEGVGSDVVGAIAALERRTTTWITTCTYECEVHAFCGYLRWITESRNHMS